MNDEWIGWDAWIAWRIHTEFPLVEGESKSADENG